MPVEYHEVDQNSDEWFELRAGKPTASEFGKVITGTGKLSSSLENYAAQLAAEKFAGTQLERWEGNQWTERGHELEEMAAMSYAMKHQVSPELVGFATNEDVGCSPDRLVGDDGLLEIKNLAPANHVLALSRYAAKGSIEPKYIPQLQGQLCVTERKWVDLYFHNPDLPCLTVRFERDEKYICTMKGYLEDCKAVRDQYIKVMEGIK